MAENTIDELARRPASEFTGPKDPDLRQLILYIRQHVRTKEDTGKRAKRSEVAEKVDPDLWEIIAAGRKIEKKKAFRRF